MSEWWTAVQNRLERLANAEYKSQLAAWLKAGRSKRTFRYSPPEWHRDAVAALGRNDEEGAKLALLNVG